MAIIFSHPIGSLFILLIMTFYAQKIFILMKFNLFIYVFFLLILWVQLDKQVSHNTPHIKIFNKCSLKVEFAWTSQEKMTLNIEVMRMKVGNFSSPIPKSEKILQWKIVVIQLWVKPVLNCHEARGNLHLSHLVEILVHSTL